jgi:predicted nucleic acid-binding protein
MPGGDAPTLSVLVDTNVVLDLILGREPWAAEAAALFDSIAQRRHTGFIAGHSITALYYLVHRVGGAERARMAVADALQVLSVVPLQATDFLRALSMELTDYEDAMQAVASLKAGATFLVTRNPKDFANGPVAVRRAGEVLALCAEG